MPTCMLEAKYLVENICSEAMNVSSYIYNRVPHSLAKVKTPFEAYFGLKPDVSNFRVFGSTTWDRIPLYNIKYLKPQSVEFIFIGYPEEEKG